MGVTCPRNVYTLSAKWYWVYEWMHERVGRWAGRWWVGGWKIVRPCFFNSISRSLKCLRTPRRIRRQGSCLAPWFLSTSLSPIIYWLLNMISFGTFFLILLSFKTSLKVISVERWFSNLKMHQNFWRLVKTQSARPPPPPHNLPELLSQWVWDGSRKICISSSQVILTLLDKTLRTTVTENFSWFLHAIR